MQRLHARSHPARALLLWLLALVVPLQCSAAMVRVAAGPMHSHADAMSAPITVLRDFRRDIGHADRFEAAAAPAALATLLHGHGHPQRHHHRPGDAGVVTGDGEAALERIDASDDGSGSGGAFASLLPLIGAEASWPATAAARDAPTSTPWAATSRVAAALERPPRGTAQ